MVAFAAPEVALVAAEILGEVQHGVGLAIEFEGVGSRVGEGHAAVGRGHVQANDLTLEGDLLLEGCLQQPGHHLAGGRQVGIRQDERELLAADAADMVDSTQFFLQTACHHAQDPVADLMTETVVDVLEAIQIDDDQRQRRIRAPRPLEFEGELGIEEGTIVDAGQGVPMYPQVDIPLMLPTPGDETRQAFGQGEDLVPALGEGRHKEEEAVELFAANVVKAGDEFRENPMDTPFIPPWNRVISAVPHVLEELRDAVEQDMEEFGS